MPVCKSNEFIYLLSISSIIFAIVRAWLVFSSFTLTRSPDTTRKSRSTKKEKVYFVELRSSLKSYWNNSWYNYKINFSKRCRKRDETVKQQSLGKTSNKNMQLITKHCCKTTELKSDVPRLTIHCNMYKSGCIWKLTSDWIKLDRMRSHAIHWSYVISATNRVCLGPVKRPTCKNVAAKK